MARDAEDAAASVQARADREGRTSYGAAPLALYGRRARSAARWRTAGDVGKVAAGIALGALLCAVGAGAWRRLRVWWNARDGVDTDAADEPANEAEADA